jgi:hypothetical protein
VNKEKEKIQKSEEALSSKETGESPKKLESPKRKSHRTPEKQARSHAVREGARHQASQAESSDVIVEIKRLREKCERFLEDIAKEPQKLVKAEANWKVPATCPADMHLTPPPRWIQSKDFSFEQPKQFTATMHYHSDLESSNAVTHTTSIPRANLFGIPASSQVSAPAVKESTSFVDKATSPLCQATQCVSLSQFNMMTSPAPALSPALDSLPSTKKVASDTPMSPGTPLSPGTEHFIGWALAAQRLCSAPPTSSTFCRANTEVGSSTQKKAADDIDSKIRALLGSKH